MPFPWLRARLRAWLPRLVAGRDYVPPASSNDEPMQVPAPPPHSGPLAPAFPRPPVRPPALPTAFNRKQIPISQSDEQAQWIVFAVVPRLAVPFWRARQSRFRTVAGEGGTLSTPIPTAASLYATSEGVFCWATIMPSVWSVPSWHLYRSSDGLDWGVILNPIAFVLKKYPWLREPDSYSCP